MKIYILALFTVFIAASCKSHGAYSRAIQILSNAENMQYDDKLEKNLKKILKTGKCEKNKFVIFRTYVTSGTAKEKITKALDSVKTRGLSDFKEDADDFAAKFNENNNRVGCVSIGENAENSTSCYDKIPKTPSLDIKPLWERGLRHLKLYATEYEYRLKTDHDSGEVFCLAMVSSTGLRSVIVIFLLIFYSEYFTV